MTVKIKLLITSIGLSAVLAAGMVDGLGWWTLGASVTLAVWSLALQ